MAFSIGMDRPTGYALWDGGDGRRLQADTFTCAHCNTVVFMPTAQDAREMRRDTVQPFGHCLSCQKPVCGRCADRGTCTPFERILERWEARDRFLRAAGL